MNLSEDPYSPQPKTAPSGRIPQDEPVSDLDISKFAGHQVFLRYLKDKFKVKNAQIWSDLEKYLFHSENKYQDKIRILRMNLDNVKRQTRTISAN